MKDADQELIGALTRVGREFRSGELAYLATTMKVEAAFRDRLAFILHEDYEPAGFVVAREWNRVDLAVLNANGTPLSLVELKAMYTFDAFKNLDFFTSATSADELKAQGHSLAETAVYSLLLVTHLSGVVEKKFKKAVKYSTPINSAVRTYGDAGIVREKAAEAINGKLMGRKVVAQGDVSGGNAFGLDVSVIYWLVRNDRPSISN